MRYNYFLLTTKSAMITKQMSHYLEYLSIVPYTSQLLRSNNPTHDIQPKKYLQYLH